MRPSNVSIASIIDGAIDTWSVDGAMPIVLGPLAAMSEAGWREVKAGARLALVIPKVCDLVVAEPPARKTAPFGRWSIRAAA